MDVHHRARPGRAPRLGRSNGLGRRPAVNMHPNDPRRWNAPTTAWSNQPHGHWPPPGQQPPEYRSPVPPGPQTPNKRSGGAGLAVAIVIAVVVAFAVLPLALRAGVRHLTLGAAIDKVDIPRLIEEHLPCKRHCKVSMIGLGMADSISVTVQSEDVEGRNLSYSVWSRGATLNFSTDGRSAAHFDYRDIDWLVVTKLEEDLNRMAARGRSVNTIIILPCDSKKSESRPCVDAEVLTPKGNFKRRIDAISGDVVWEG
jgi:hypothetical protein